MQAFDLLPDVVGVANAIVDAEESGADEASIVAAARQLQQRLEAARKLVPTLPEIGKSTAEVQKELEAARAQLRAIEGAERMLGEIGGEVRADAEARMDADA